MNKEERNKGRKWLSALSRTAKASAGLILLGVAVMSAGTAAAGEKTLRISTTTSTQSSGLLEVLIPAFEKETGIAVHVIAKGTGAALRDGMDGNVDLVFVHDPEREAAFVAEGYGVRRYPVMYNDFVIVGPPDDPAAIGKSLDATRAFKSIANKKAPFVSRGDDSGTHAKELELWEKSGIPLATETRSDVKNGQRVSVETVYPKNAGSWYMSIGQGMGKTLIFAEEKEAYALTDRGTYLKYRYGNDRPIDLAIVFEGDENLNNPYGVIPVNPERFPHINAKGALRFAEWLTSEKGQTLIADYKLHGQALFFPDK